jgi:Tfp pilus assembly protein FimV
MADYAKELRDMQERVEQSDSGMMRSDETKARLRNLSERIRQAESAGAGRGKQGGPTAKELADYERKQDAGIYTAEKGNPPQDVDSASAPVKKAKGGMTAKFMSFSKTGKPAGMKKVTKMASGGSASSRADGVATKGKTNCKMY